jgi:hypothetical protein
LPATIKQTSKMKKTILLFTVYAILFSSVLAQKQSIYIPRDIVKAYEKGTRSYDGKPGVNYWTNHADYKIKAELFPATREVKGSEEIIYYNDSPDSIKQLVIRLYQDVMRKGSARDFSISASDLTDGIKIDTMLINGKGIDLKAKDQQVARRMGTNLFLRKLPETIAPKSSVKIETKWSVIIPRETKIRMGAYSDSTFYIAYWYPQISVYDDIEGWDRNDYGGAVEFYNDKNNFELEYTVPGDFIVWGSGLYENLEEILKPEIAERYKKAWNAEEIIKVITKEDLKNGVTNGKEKNVWRLKASGVSDISWAASSCYVWDATSVEVDDNGRRVLTDAVYPPISKSYEDVALFAKLTVQQLSKNLPGEPFPYPKITTFNGETQGGGGMEMPMMCNNGIAPRPAQAGVTLHEIAHDYFPFYMGINERKYAWMDEGWATFFTSANIEDVVDAPGAESFEGLFKQVNNIMGREYDIPSMAPSIAARGPLSGFTAYPKAASSYYFLKDILGDQLFKQALQEYIKRWNGKHPLPYDFFFTFNDVAKQDLSWFWKPWYFEQGYPDLAVKNVVSSGGKTEVVIEKVGNVPVPIDLEVTYSDNTKENIYKNTASWKNGNTEFLIELNGKKEIKKVELLTKRSADAEQKNNVWEKK